MDMSWVGGSSTTLAEAFQNVGVLRGSRRRGGPVDRLVPMPTEIARSQSLSARFGSGAFPLHTDGAYLRRPPRLLVLYCVRDTERRPTRLLRWDLDPPSAGLLSKLHRETYWFQNGRHSFLDTIVAPQRGFVRFDSGCMIPATRQASATLVELSTRLSARPCDDVHWVDGMALIIDNWRVLHGRGTAASFGTRTLLRLQLDPNGTNE